MQATLENISDIERLMTIEVPAAELTQQVEKKLLELSKRVKLDGFRPGKAPMAVIRKRYQSTALQDAVETMIPHCLHEAIAEKNISIVGQPKIEIISIDETKPFIFKATFEIYPEVTLPDFSQLNIEIFEANIQPQDVEKTLNSIRKQHATWNPVERAAIKGDQVVMDFHGTMNGEAFEGGHAHNYTLELGSGSFIPGFEDQIVGHQQADEFVVETTFPDDYHQKELAGKLAQFKVKLHQIKEPHLPEENDDFAKLLGVETVEKLRADIQKNMQRELEYALKQQRHYSVLTALNKVSSFPVPKVLIQTEIHRIVQSFFKNMPNKPDVSAFFKDLPPSVLESLELQARERVVPGLLLVALIKEFNLTADDARVRKSIESIASAYEKPEEIIRWYYSDEKQLQQIKEMVVEELAIEKILERAHIETVTKNFDDIIRSRPHSHK